MYLSPNQSYKNISYNGRVYVCMYAYNVLYI